MRRVSRTLIDPSKPAPKKSRKVRLRRATTKEVKVFTNHGPWQVGRIRVQQVITLFYASGKCQMTWEVFNMDPFWGLGLVSGGKAIDAAGNVLFGLGGTNVWWALSPQKFHEIELLSTPLLDFDPEEYPAIAGVEVVFWPEPNRSKK